MKLERVTYRAAHALELMKARAEMTSLGWYGQNGVAWAQRSEGAGPAWSMLKGSQVVACAGVALEPWPAGTAWGLFGELFFSHVKTCWREIKGGLERVQKEQGLVRISTYVLAADPRALNFVEHLGFKLEGFLEAWGPNAENFLVLGRVRRDG